MVPGLAVWIAAVIDSSTAHSSGVRSVIVVLPPVVSRDARGLPGGGPLEEAEGVPLAHVVAGGLEDPALTVVGDDFAEDQHLDGGQPFGHHRLLCGKDDAVVGLAVVVAHRPSRPLIAVHTHAMHAGLCHPSG